MAADGEADANVIGRETLGIIHLRERGVFARWLRFKERPGGTRGEFRFPHGASPMRFLKKVQRAHFAQTRELAFAQDGNAIHQILNARERTPAALIHNGARGLFRQPAHVIQAQPHPLFAAMIFDGTEPIRGSDIDRLEMLPCFCASFTSVAGA